MLQSVSNASFGMQGELIVAEHLKKQGFIIREMNYRKRYGEIDIIAATKDLVVFVEVKTRSREYVDNSVLVPRSKQKKIAMVAKEYIARSGIITAVFRFDVAFIVMNADRVSLCYIDNAFVDEE